MSALEPRLCMSTYGTPRAAMSGNIAGSAPPLTSLTSTAPASSAASATDARAVSTLTRAPAATSPATTGSTRSRSSVSVTRTAPGRVDSPPTSSTSAPSFSICSPARTADSGDSNRPPSENESGVTLTMPITRVRPRLGKLRTVIARSYRTSAPRQDQGHGLAARGGGGSELATDGGGERDRPRLANASDGHAQVFGLDDHDDPAG